MFFKIPSKKSSKKEEEKIVGTNTSVIDQPVSNYTSSVLILLGGLPEWSMLQFKSIDSSSNATL